MRRVVCPGSFDPVTNGHLDIISRASAVYDEVIVAVVLNPSKIPMFTADERVEMLRDVLKERPNVTVAQTEARSGTSAGPTTSRPSSRACERSATLTTRCRWRR